MELKFFTDLIDALGKVASGLKSLGQFPKTERATIRRTLDETYRLIDTTLNMVIIRLGDVEASTSDQDFIQEVAKLANYDDWMQAEREFRLCKSLRAAVRETETLAGKVVGRLSTADWDALLHQMRSVLATEGEVASFISESFRELAESARTPANGRLDIDAIKTQVAALRGSLINERRELIRQEIELHSLV